MAPLRLSITSTLALVVLGIHALLLPALYFGLGIVIRDSHTELFVQNVRTLSRHLAEEMEGGDVPESKRRVADFLDLAILRGEGVYAELVDNGVSTRSNLNSPDLHWAGAEDFEFGQGGDFVYWIKLPVERPGHSAELRLGFDERPISAQIRLATRRILVALAVYLTIALSMALAFGIALSRPVLKLKRDARRIASGDYSRSMRLDTRVRELHELGADLENMRGELVGVGQRLSAEIDERKRGEVKHAELERRLRHRQRVETVGTLAGGIAHEINNALLPIMLLAESALAELPEGSAMRPDLEGILSSARRAKEIVAKVLTFSREAGQAQLERLDLEPVTREALRLFGMLVPSSVDVRFDIDGPCPPVIADAALTVQLIMNLCTNGYQAMNGQFGKLSLSLRVERVEAGEGQPAAGDYVVLSVTDTGHGMDAATLEHIFEPFFTTREVGQGSGLGLAVVHGIAESFGATILVESAVGRGSTFRVYFPVADRAVGSTTEARDLSGVRV